MSPVGQVLHLVLLVFLVLLIFRLVMDYVFMLARSFRPQGPFAIALELTYSATDPPIKAVRRVVPPLRLGGVGIDLAFLIVALAVQVAANLLR